MTMGQRQGFGQPVVEGLLIGAAICFACFLFVETRVAQPMIDLSMFRNALFSLNLLMALVVFIILTGVVIFPFFLELVKGYRTEQVGLIMMVTPIAMGVVAPVAGSLSDRFGSRGISLIGLLIIAGGCLSISTLHKDVSVFGYIIRMIPMGVGIGVFTSPNSSAIMGAVPRERLGVASGLMTLSRTMGQTTGLPLMTSLFITLVYSHGHMAKGSALETAPAEALVAGVTKTHQVAALAVCLSILMAAVALWIDRRRRKAQKQAQA
jgi:MFS family permease